MRWLGYKRLPARIAAWLDGRPAVVPPHIEHQEAAGPPEAAVRAELIARGEQSLKRVHAARRELLHLLGERVVAGGFVRVQHLLGQVGHRHVVLGRHFPDHVADVVRA